MLFLLAAVSSWSRFSAVSPSYRGSESRPGRRDPVPTEGDGEGDREEDLGNRGSARQLSLLLCDTECSGIWWDAQSRAPLNCFSLFTDAAFLAREKARADAEYYTAAKFAEANMVK